MKYYALLLAITLCSLSCKKKQTVDQSTVDNGIITKYIADNKLTAKATNSGLYYVITTQGAGAQPSSSSNVTVTYKGYLTDGTVFDQTTTNAGATFNLANVIQGWQEGIPLFKKGTKGTLLIPSSLGYGSQATGKIPANSVLIFDIVLLDVK